MQLMSASISGTHRNAVVFRKSNQPGSLDDCVQGRLWALATSFPHHQASTSTATAKGWSNLFSTLCSNRSLSSFIVPLWPMACTKPNGEAFPGLSGINGNYSGGAPQPPLRCLNKKNFTCKWGVLQGFQSYKTNRIRSPSVINLRAPQVL